MNQPSEEAMRIGKAIAADMGPHYTGESIARMIDQETNLPALKVVLEQAKAFCACANEFGPWSEIEIESIQYLREAIARAERKEP